MPVYTYQDFDEASDRLEFVKQAVAQHKAGPDLKMALIADDYDRQRNRTVLEYVKTLYSMDGRKVEDFTAEPTRIPSNFFNRLNTQRVMYSLGNGVSFVQPDEAGESDEVKERLGEGFDHRITEAAYYACIHGVSFVFWNLDRIHLFKLTEFCPLYDRHTGKLRAGIRFWRLNPREPETLVLYTEGGYIEYREDEHGRLVAQSEDYLPYKTTYRYTPADDSAEIVGEENYGALPIVPMWASRLKQSTLVGMRAAIDAYDLIKSGFASDMQQCAEIYWIIKNAPGMNDADLMEFRDRLKLQHIAAVDGMDGAEAVPYTQEIPHSARQAFLQEIRNGIYEDFGALDVHTVSAGATNDHIDAAYQPMDENAADFEYWVAECITQILALLGIDDRPVFKRTRISNQREQVEMVVQEAQWLDQATVLRKLPNITPDEANAILQGTQAEDMARFGIGGEDG